MSKAPGKFNLPDTDPIDSIALHTVAMPLVETLNTSFGGNPMRTPVLVELHIGDAVGWGECVANLTPDYSYETIGTAVHILRDFFIPAVVGQRNLNGLHKYRGHPMARMALEAAYWTAVAAQRGVSFGDLLGDLTGEQRKARVEVGVSIGIQSSIDATLAVIEKRLNEGYRRIKLKIKPGWDIEMLRAVRRTYPNLVLMADANSAYTLDDARLFKQIDALNLLMIEQPLGHDDIYQHSKLQP